MCIRDRLFVTVITRWAPIHSPIRIGCTERGILTTTMREIVARITRVENGDEIWLWVAQRRCIGTFSGEQLMMPRLRPLLDQERTAPGREVIADLRRIVTAASVQGEQGDLPDASWGLQFMGYLVSAIMLMCEGLVRVLRWVWQASKAKVAVPTAFQAQGKARATRPSSPKALAMTGVLALVSILGFLPTINGIRITEEVKEYENFSMEDDWDYLDDLMILDESWITSCPRPGFPSTSFCLLYTSPSPRD